MFLIPHLSILPWSGIHPQISHWARVTSWSVLKPLHSKPGPMLNLMLLLGLLPHRLPYGQYFPPQHFVPNENKTQSSPLGATNPYKSASVIPALSQSTGGT